MSVHDVQKKFHMASISILCLIGCYIIVRGSIAFGDGLKADSIYRLRYLVETALQEAVVTAHMPGFTYVMEGGAQESGDLTGWLGKRAMDVVPLFSYVEQSGTCQTGIESDLYEQILLGEAMDENSVDEAGQVRHSDGAADVEDTLSALMKDENAHAGQGGVTYEMSQLKDYDFLLSHFYVVDKSTDTNAAQLNAEVLLGKDMALTGAASKPQILIYHTHSQEGFADSVQGDAATSVVGVGDRLTQLLTARGYNVIHHTGQYDLQSRNYAYSNAGPAIEGILLENPSIEVIIDLHRDGVAEGTRLVKEVDGRMMAQFMFFNGLSYTTSTGPVSYLENPYIEDNLAFALQLQLKCNEYYPGLARKIYLKGYRYNMHYRPKSLLLEVGAQTNTVEEAMNTMEPVADVLDQVLSGK